MTRHLLAVAAALALAAPAAAQTKFLGKDRSDWHKELAGGDAAARRGAAFALGKLGSDRDLDPLLKALRDEDAGVRAAAAAAVGDIAARPNQGTAANWRSASPELIRLLKGDADPRVRRGAAYALGAFGPLAAAEAPALRAALTTDAAAPVRQNAAWALGRLADRAAAEDVDSLSRALEDADPLVRRDAATALGDLLAAGGKADPGLDKRVVRDGVNALLGLVGREAGRGRKGDPVVLKTALQKAVNIVGEEQRTVVGPVQTLLSDPDPETVRYAAFVLANVGGAPAQAALPSLRDLLNNDDDAAVRESAAACLGRLGGDAQSAVPDLARALGDDRAPGLRRAAVVSLSQIAGAVRQSAYEKKTVAEQEAVFERLKALGKPELVKALARVLRTAPPAERAARLYAAETLAALGGPANRDALPDVMDVLGNPDEDPDVRHRCVWVFFYVPNLEEAGADKVLTKILDETGDRTRFMRYDAARALAFNMRERAPDQAAAVLLKMLGDKVSIYSGTGTGGTNTGGEAGRHGNTTTEEKSGGDGRYMAAQALGQMGRKANKPEIIDALQKAAADPDPTLSKAAREALGRIK
jgi:HEAT repeat protein